MTPVSTLPIPTTLNKAMSMTIGTPTPATGRKPLQFSGRHILAILLAFFGLVIVVNVYMAHLATATFTGEVTDNGYVASQNFNRWLDEAAREKALGWKAVVARQADGRLVVTVSGPGTEGAALAGQADRPLGTGVAAIRNIAFTRGAGGSFVSDAKLADGRWHLRLTLSAQGKQWHSLETI